MDKFLNALFSMRAMAIAMLIFFAAIAKATFIESDHGVQAAKLTVYNAPWFTVLLGYLTLNLIANIVRYKMWNREKIAMLSFHLAFIIIIIGAGITRQFGFEGLMPVREGETVNYIYSADPYLWLKINDGKQQLTYDEKMYLSDYNNNHFLWDFEFPKHKNPIYVEYVDFLPKHVDSMVVASKYSTSVLEIVTNGMQSNYLGEGDVFALQSTQISFGSQKVMDGINVYRKNGVLMIRPTMDMQYIPMAMMQQARQTGAPIPDSAYVKVKQGEEVPFATTTLYTIGMDQFVFKKEIRHAKKMKLPSGSKDKGTDYLIVRVSDGKESKEITLQGGMGMIPTPEFFVLGGLTYQMEYGSKKIELPFSIRCNDFNAERYPGSEVASSYASDLQVIDSVNKVNKHKRVFMNHVLDYEGYRLFQSGYDPDEKGTRLSVNYDFWGTNVTYLGYLLMSIGMLLSLFARGGRFRELISKLSRVKPSVKTVALLMGMSLLSGFATAQEHNHKATVHYITEEHSDKMAALLVQDFDGRIVPMHTVCDQLLRKLYRSNKYEGHNAIQTIISIQMYPEYWIDQKIIQVPSAVREKYHLDDYATLKQLSDKNFQFKWLADYNIAMQKSEAKRSETEKKLIKLVEKHQVMIGLLQWYYMKVVPVSNDPGNTWYVPRSPEIQGKDTLTSNLALLYFKSLYEGDKTGGYREAERNLGYLKKAQRSIAPAKILPSETHVKVEISYNKMGIFKNTQYSYLLLGFALLLMYFLRMFSRNEVPSRGFTITRKVLVALLVVIFFYHLSGLLMRWYISGHAPWSNGYEAVIFIAWVTMLAGFIFSRYHTVILGAAALLAYFMIFVTEMNLLDPEITPLQPVLKSYWLMIHVAIITGSYGFLGLSAILGIVNLANYLARGTRYDASSTYNINQITYVSEMTMTVGVFMLTIGTFLGGIWANESWGRYWGWDPKETWALVSILVYAIILHLRFIPGLKGKFLFNALSVWGYCAILFTFFGVNFILVGLHSYAQGDGAVSLPPWVIGVILFFVVFTAVAALINTKYVKNQRKQLE